MTTTSYLPFLQFSTKKATSAMKGYCARTKSLHRSSIACRSLRNRSLTEKLEFVVVRNPSSSVSTESSSSRSSGSSSFSLFSSELNLCSVTLALLTGLCSSYRRRCEDRVRGIVATTCITFDRKSHTGALSFCFGVAVSSTSYRRFLRRISCRADPEPVKKSSVCCNPSIIGSSIPSAA